MAKNIDIDELRRLIIAYHKSRGCGCCSDYDERTKAEDALGEYLGFDLYCDGSGYDLHKLPGESNDN